MSGGAAEVEVVESARLTADVVLFAAPLGVPCVLLIRRGWPPFQGMWALPGGHLDAGERPLHAALRELDEETGIRLSSVQLELVGVYGEPGRDPRGRYVSFAYAAVLPKLRRAAAGDDAVAVEWVPLEGALFDELAFDHGRIVRAAAYQALGWELDEPVLSEGGLADRMPALLSPGGWVTGEVGPPAGWAAVMARFVWTFFYVFVIWGIVVGSWPLAIAGLVFLVAGGLSRVGRGR